MITEKQTSYGSKFLETLSKDLISEFPEMSGFSVTNLGYCKQFYIYFSIPPQVVGELKPSKRTQVGGELILIDNQTVEQLFFQLPWGHIRLIIGKIKELKEAQFYLQQTL